MGRKNARARQARLQRKRNKRAAARSGRQGSEHGPPPKQMLVKGALVCCQTLFAGQPLSGESLELARMVRVEVGGVLGRIPLELHAFLFEDKPWPFNCGEIAPLRGVFEKNYAEDVFERIWSLALTHEQARPELFDEDLLGQECAHRAASAFESLRACLDEPKRSPSSALRLIVAEAERHGASTRLRKSYDKLLRAALAAARASAGKRQAQLTKLGSEAAEVFELAQREQADAAWWECGRVFLKEVLQRLQGLPQVTGSSAHAELSRKLLDAPQAAVELARSGKAEALSSVHPGAQARCWSTFLARALDVGALPFDERVRYQIAQLKLLRLQVLQLQEHDAEVRELLATYRALQNLLSHGVPPQSRAIPAALAAPLLDFYVELLESLRCEAQALRLTEEQLHAHPEDFRLACLFATGALQANEPFRLSFLAQHAPVRHVSPELFAQSMHLWSRTPQGKKAASTLRERLLDPLVREDRKQCLIALSKQCLRRAGTLREYESELAAVLPYFPRDSFVLAELGEQTALESSLVFLASMIAPLHALKLTLTEEQSQQWVSYAREIARQSRLGSELVLRCLKNPPKGVSLAPAVLKSARAHLSDFKPVSAAALAPPPPPPKPVTRRRKKKSSPQQELFDGLDP